MLKVHVTTPGLEDKTVLYGAVKLVVFALARIYPATFDVPVASLVRVRRPPFILAPKSTPLLVTLHTVLVPMFVFAVVYVVPAEVA
jgi:hypothetical protein